MSSSSSKHQPPIADEQGSGNEGAVWENLYEIGPSEQFSPSPNLNVKVSCEVIHTFDFLGWEQVLAANNNDESEEDTLSSSFCTDESDEDDEQVRPIIDLEKGEDFQGLDWGPDPSNLNMDGPSDTGQSPPRSWERLTSLAQTAQTRRQPPINFGFLDHPYVDDSEDSLRQPGLTAEETLSLWQNHIPFSTQHQAGIFFDEDQNPVPERPLGIRFLGGGRFEVTTEVPNTAQQVFPEARARRAQERAEMLSIPRILDPEAYAEEAQEKSRGQGNSEGFFSSAQAQQARAMTPQVSSPPLSPIAPASTQPEAAPYEPPHEDKGKGKGKGKARATTPPVPAVSAAPAQIPALDDAEVEQLCTEVPDELFPLAALLQQMRDCEETGDLLAALNSQCRMGLAQGLSRDPLNQHALGGDPDAVGEMNDFHRKLAEIASEYMARTWAAFDRRQMLAPGTSQPSRDEWLRVIRMFYLHEICQREMIIARRGREAPRQERGFVSAKAKDTLDAPWRKWLQKLAFWEAEQLFCIVTYLRSVFDGLQARLDSNHLHRLEDGKILLPPNNMNFHGVALLYEAHRVEDASERADLLTADDRAYVWTITSMGLRNHLSTLGGLKGGMMFTQDSFPDPSSGAKCAWKWSLGPSESIIQVGRERTADARDWGYMFMDRERLEQHQVLNQPFLVRGSLPRDRPR